MRFSTLGLIFTGLLTGCASNAPTAPGTVADNVTSFYDYQLHAPSGEAISVNQLTPEIQQADVILIGEWHTHAGIHRFQTDMLKQLSSANRPLALSMEQVTRDKQALSLIHI